MRNISLLAVAMGLVLTLTACSVPSVSTSSERLPPNGECGEIYLYGEKHGVDKILDKELELWCEYYNDQDMRHLFIEFPYYTGELLNLWMQADSDDILEELFADLVGTAAQSPNVKEFYQSIKLQCPDTVFHGTDVGHQYASTGEHFLSYLQESGAKNSEQYTLAEKAIEQGKHYYETNDNAYRENMMAENFINEYDKLGGENIMGIYGSAHTGLSAMEYSTGTVAAMASQLSNHYKTAIHSEDLSWMEKDIAPLREDTLEVNGKEYKALYFGSQDLTKLLKGYTSREFWRLENAYEDFAKKAATGDMLPYDNYPMLIETEQIFVIDYTKEDGSVDRMYYRSDDDATWNGNPSTAGFAFLPDK